MIDKCIREIERERQGLQTQTQEKILIVEIKKSAKQGQMILKCTLFSSRALLRSWLKTLSDHDTRLRNSTTLSPNCKACSLEFRHVDVIGACWRAQLLPLSVSAFLPSAWKLLRESDMIPRFSVSETPGISGDSMAIDGDPFHHSENTCFLCFRSEFFFATSGWALQGMYADAVSQLELLKVIGFP
ncbi:hypothetical protein Tco_0304925 [Tanacetum coccineum]